MRILGESHEPLVCRDADEIRAQAVAMIEQTERHLDIFTHDFEPRVYNHDDIHQALENLALKSRYSRIRILIRDPEEIARTPHRVIELGKFLVSHFAFRCPVHHHPLHNQTFLVADEIGVIHRPYADAFTAHVNYCDGPFARELSERFEEWWEEAEENPNFRYLSL